MHHKRLVVVLSGLFCLILSKPVVMFVLRSGLAGRSICHSSLRNLALDVTSSACSRKAGAGGSHDLDLWPASYRLEGCAHQGYMLQGCIVPTYKST